MTFRQLLPCVLAVAWACSPGAVQAAQSFDACTGFIDTLPATVSTPGTWCLRANLSTAQATGNAITLAGDHITLDCNDKLLVGLGAGAGTQARGVYAKNRAYTTVRRCNVRGFAYGIFLDADANEAAAYARVEDNRLDYSRLHGIRVLSDDSVVQRNLLTNSGHSTLSPEIVAIGGRVDRVLDNTVEMLVPEGDPGETTSYGIRMTSSREVRGNRVRTSVGSDEFPPFYSVAISVAGGLVIDNQVVGRGDVGLQCVASARSVRNHAVDFPTPIAGCTRFENIEAP